MSLPRYSLIALFGSCLIGACGSGGGAESSASGAGGAEGSASSSGTGGSASIASGSGSSSSGSVGSGGAAGSTATSSSSSSSGDAGGGAYNPCPTNGDPCKVLPLGDSITWGIQYEGAYRVELFRRAVVANQNITFVGSLMDGPATIAGVAFPPQNEGHSGWTINQEASLIPSPALDGAPDIILLLIGTNDTYQADPGGAPQRLATLLDTILSMDTHALLVVSLITPYPSQASNVAAYNAAIPALVQARAADGKHILLADVNTGFQVSTMLSSDGIHPNQTGYEFMGGVWYGVVGPFFPQKQ
jgi:lysophospholipase L1-like esterase